MGCVRRRGWLLETHEHRGTKHSTFAPPRRTPSFPDPQTVIPCDEIAHRAICCGLPDSGDEIAHSVQMEEMSCLELDDGVEVSKPSRDLSTRAVPCALPHFHGLSSSLARLFPCRVPASACPCPPQVTTVSLAANGDELLVGLSTGSVNLYGMPTTEFKATITRFPAAPVRSVAFFHDRFLVATGEEPGLRLVSAKDHTKMLTFGESSSSGVRSVAVDPLGRFLAAVGIDGTLRLYEIPAAAQDSPDGLPDSVEIEEVWREIIAGRDDGAEENSLQLARPAWHPKGACLAIPGSRHIKLRMRGEGGRNAGQKSWPEELVVGADEVTHAANVMSLR